MHANIRPSPQFHALHLPCFVRLDKVSQRFGRIYTYDDYLHRNVPIAKKFLCKTYVTYCSVKSKLSTPMKFLVLQHSSRRRRNHLHPPRLLRSCGSLLGKQVKGFSCVRGFLFTVGVRGVHTHPCKALYKSQFDVSLL